MINLFFLQSLPQTKLFLNFAKDIKKHWTKSNKSIKFTVDVSWGG